MHILLTGCTSFVGRFVLRDLVLQSNAEKKITCLLPTGITLESIQTDSLYSGLDFSFCKETNELSFDELGPPTIVLCCGDDVKFTADYADIYRDTVLGIKTLCDSAIVWKVKKLILLSSCYIHPRGTIGKAELVPKNLPKSIFLHDSMYARYLAEHVVTTYADKISISILRLTSPGAPSNWLDAHPSYKALGHLALVSMILRGRIQKLDVPSSVRINTVPVNVLAECIVKEVQTVRSKGLFVQQLCAPPNHPWNLSAQRLYQVLKRLAPRVFVEGMEPNSVGWNWLSKHSNTTNQFAPFFEQQYFESSIPSQFSEGDQTIYEQTCYYVARGIHQFAIEKGFLRPRLERFWCAIPEHFVHGQLIFKKPIVFTSKKEAQERVFHGFSGFRPFFTEPTGKLVKYSRVYEPQIYWESDSTTKNLDPTTCKIHLLGDYSSLTGLKFVFDHSVGDGIALLSVLPRLISIGSEKPQQCLETSTMKPRTITSSQEFICFVYYLASMIKCILKPSTKTSLVLGDTTVKMDTHIFHKEPDTSFTVSLLRKTYPVFRSALEKDTVLYCIPASIKSPRDRGLSMPSNAFVPILLPVSSKPSLIQEMCLHSIAVKTIAWIICQSIALGEFEMLRDLFTSRIDVVFSSLLGSDSPLDNVDSLNVYTPTPRSIPISMCSVSIGSETHVTVTSSIVGYSAEKITREILLSV
jgi:thioester reductase-like protein